MNRWSFGKTSKASTTLEKGFDMATNEAQEFTSRFQAVLNEINRSRHHINEAISLLNSLIFDLSKADAFMSKFQTTLTKAIQDDGGEVKTIEQEMMSFV